MTPGLPPEAVAARADILDLIIDHETSFYRLNSLADLADRLEKQPPMGHIPFRCARTKVTSDCRARKRDDKQISRRSPFEKKFIRKERSMPTYVCYLPRDRFSQDQKDQIADAISFRHSEATGAPSYFVQVVIDETRADRYLGGERTSDHIWIRGDIRAGRTEEQRTGMMTKMMQDISRITSIGQENVWVYVCNLDPTDMIEYGHVLPLPGQEKAWFESLPRSLRTYLANLGTTKENFQL